MGPKKGLKVQSRWQPLPEDATTMQTMTIPEVDEHLFRPEDMSKEDLVNCCKFIDQSNRTLEVENSIVERYLSKMDPNALAKMNQFLEAAAIALQKTERTTHLGGGGSSQSLGKEDSLSSSSRGGTAMSKSRDKSTSNQAGKQLGILGLTDRGPKVQAAQKIEIVNREIDELKSALENFRAETKKSNYLLKCKNEGMREQLEEVTEATNEFEQKLLVEGLDPLTGKLSGEKFIRYLEMSLKGEEIEIDRMRIKTGSLKSQLKRVEQQLLQKEELGEILHAVDFEQLQIENRDCQERLDERIAHVIDTKKINGRYGNLLNVYNKKLHEQMGRLSRLQQIVVVKEKMIKQLSADEEKIDSEVKVTAKAVDKIVRLMKSYTVPELIDYIKTKAGLHAVKKEIKVCERQMKLKDLTLASQVQRIKSMHVDFSKSSNFESQPILRESRIFF